MMINLNKVWNDNPFDHWTEEELLCMEEQGICYGKGSSSPPPPPTVTTQTQVSEFPTELRPFISDIFEKSQAVQEQRQAEGFQPELTQQLAPFTGDQQTAFEGIRQQVGQTRPLFEEATELARSSARGATDPAELAALMNPFLRNVVDIEKREAERVADVQEQQLAARAAQAGAFGGSRAGIIEAERQRNLATQLGDIESRGLALAFQDAQNRLQNQFGREASAAGQLSALGTAIPAQTFKELGALSGVGAAEQQQGQRALDIATQQAREEFGFPQQTLQDFSSILRGFPLPATTNVSKSTFSPAQPLSTQLIGLGAGLAGLAGNAGAFKKAGGRVGAPVGLKNGGYIKLAGGGGLGEMMQENLPSNRVRMGKVAYQDVGSMSSDPTLAGMLETLKMYQQNAARGTAGAADQVEKIKISIDDYISKKGQGQGKTEVAGDVVVQATGQAAEGPPVPPPAPSLRSTAAYDPKIFSESPGATYGLEPANRKALEQTLIGTKESRNPIQRLLHSTGIGSGLVTGADTLTEGAEILSDAAFKGVLAPQAPYNPVYRAGKHLFSGTPDASVVEARKNEVPDVGGATTSTQQKIPPLEKRLEERADREEQIAAKEDPRNTTGMFPDQGVEAKVVDVEEGPDGGVAAETSLLEVSESDPAARPKDPADPAGKVETQARRELGEYYKDAEKILGKPPEFEKGEESDFTSRKWLALAQFGANMLKAGGDKTVFQAMGEAAQPALKELISISKEEKKLKGELRKERNAQKQRNYSDKIAKLGIAQKLQGADLEHTKAMADIEQKRKRGILDQKTLNETIRKNNVMMDKARVETVKAQFALDSAKDGTTTLAQAQAEINKAQEAMAKQLAKTQSLLNQPVDAADNARRIREAGARAAAIYAPTTFRDEIIDGVKQRVKVDLTQFLAPATAAGSSRARYTAGQGAPKKQG